MPKPRLLSFSLAFLVLVSCASPPASDQPPSSQPTTIPPATGSNQAVDDTAIESRVKAAINGTDPTLENSDITVTSFKGTVLITGQVESQNLKRQASNAAAFSNDEISHIVNELEVVDSIDMSTLSQDQELLERVSSLLEASDRTLATQVKAVVKKGIVYLMGTLPRDQALQAARIVSMLNGVASVRTVFDYSD